jgi:hypothetical protein
MAPDFVSLWGAPVNGDFNRWRKPMVHVVRNCDNFELPRFHFIYAWERGEKLAKRMTTPVASLLHAFCAMHGSCLPVSANSLRHTQRFDCNSRAD